MLTLKDFSILVNEEGQLLKKNNKENFCSMLPTEAIDEMFDSFDDLNDLYYLRIYIRYNSNNDVILKCGFCNYYQNPQITVDLNGNNPIGQEIIKELYEQYKEKETVEDDLNINNKFNIIKEILENQLGFYEQAQKILSSN